MRIAVTGATGFVGRHVVPLLLAEGHDVVAVTRAEGGIAQFEWSARAKEVAVPIDDPGDGLFDRLGRPELCLHLAWGMLSDFNSLHHFERELVIHYNFLRALLRGGLHKLVVSGTCLEYGLQSGALAEHFATAPVTPYGLAKDMLRCQLEFLRREIPFSLAWGRLFYMYGEIPGRRTLLVQLREAAARGDRIFRMSAGEQLRDYLSVEEVARKLVLLCRADDPGVVNICSGAPISVRRLVEGWIGDNGWDIELGLGCYPYPSYESLAFWGDTTKADRVLSL